MNKELHEGRLLDAKGNLVEAGYSTSLIKTYSRKDIKGNKLRIKEWDYYYVGDKEYGIALTIDDNSYMGLVSLSILDFKEGKEILTKSPMYWFPLGRVGLPSSSKEGNIVKEGNGYSFKFLHEGNKRRLICKMKDALPKKDFVCDIYLEESNPNYMVIATPFKKKRHFYYNQKINLLKASGYFSFGYKKHEFKEGSYGTLDWGRGVWTYFNTWFWSSANGEVDNTPIGWNLGYGFGDTSAASENMLFVGDKAYKLDDVTFNIPQKNKKDSFLEEWSITSQSGDINLTFKPLFDRKSNTNALLIQSDQHQVFGYFNGSFKANGKEIRIKDILGFAEKVKNRW